ncbi:FAD-binding domain-containing protein [Nadsonia fulvescens var. elongata DSM 6958]|uniref:D-lactate dehydrogenase (cytochrome) n=1 Tax=Nadsonia fulvescens var. elongata DSM 6958 TaxID=857566 RepID=A0A1E3PLT7_9ASCO|nr:FAD-binding domain-containing protein [Nadsonia fulvescens var. elongata DSM 6958]
MTILIGLARFSTRGVTRLNPLGTSAFRRLNTSTVAKTNTPKLLESGNFTPKAPQFGGRGNTGVKYFSLFAIGALVSSGITYYLTYQAPNASSINRVWTNAQYGDMAAFEKAMPELIAALGEDGLSIDDEDLKSHGYSEWATYNIDKNPIAIAYPRSTQEVSAIAKVCHKYRIPMIGFSGGSSLEGNFCAPNGGVCIDFCHMNQIIEVRPQDMDCTVQPAVGWMDLNAELEKQNAKLFLAVDPGPTAKIGGMVATNCSGTNCVKYGPMRDHIVNLTVVLADGTVIKTRQRPRKSSAGYNLNHIFCGSEGTLGLITEITVKLQVVPEELRIGVCAFPSVHAATNTALDIIRAGIPIHAVELMDDAQMWAINRAGYTTRSWEEKDTLLFKFSGTKSSVKEQIEKAQKIAESHGGIKFEFAKNEEEQHQIWSARKESLWSSLALGPKNGKFYGTDVAVPLSRLADLVLATKKDLQESGLFGSALGHVGDGNFHASIVYVDEDLPKVRKLAQNLVKHGLEMEGTCTGEHGVGAGKVKYLMDELGSDAVFLMRTIKLALDPYELLNPGKLFTEASVQYAKEKGL